MTNPFRKHANHLFASRGCDVDQALSYAFELVSAMPDEAKAAANTAIMVLVNTAATAFDQARGPSPERLALIELIDQRINEHKLIREDAVVNQITDWMNDHLEEYIGDNIDIEDKINDWMSNNFDLYDYCIDDVLNSWMENNLDNKIADMDLVVRVR